LSRKSAVRLGLLSAVPTNGARGGGGGYARVHNAGARGRWGGGGQRRNRSALPAPLDIFGKWPSVRGEKNFWHFATHFVGFVDQRRLRSSYCADRPRRQPPGYAETPPRFFVGLGRSR